MLRKFAAAVVIDAAYARPGTLVKDAHRHAFDYVPRPGFLYVRSRAISSRCNDNWDDFPAGEIKTSYRSFVGKPVFVNHHNDNHRRMRGVVVDAALHEDMNADGSPDTWVEVLMEVDAVKFPKLAEAIVKGHIARTSMGCDVAYSLCTFCGNKAATPLEYCQHIPALKGKRIRRRTASGSQEDVLVAEKCYGLSFFENSLLVEPPADPTAYFLGVDTRGVAAEPTTAHLVRTASLRAVEAETRAYPDYDPRTKPVDDVLEGQDFADLDRLNGDLLEQAERGRRDIYAKNQRTPIDPTRAQSRNVIENLFEEIDDLYPGDVQDAPARPKRRGSLIPVVAYDDDKVTVPPEVDTLRTVKCPAGFREDEQACGFDGHECVVCGFVQPPEQFDDPDTSKAKEFDRETDEEAVEQEDDTEENDDMTATQPRQGSPRLSALQQVEALRRAFSRQHDLYVEALEQRDREHAVALEQRDAAIARLSGVVGVQRDQITSLGHAVTFIAAKTGQTAALQQHFGMRVRADIANPAQPVPAPPSEPATTTTEAEQNAATKADLFAPGGVPGQTDVAPDGVTDINTVDGNMVAPAPDAVVDVQAPIAGTGAGEVPLQDVRTEVEIRATPIAPQTMTMASRTMAAVRLARLRIEAGTADGDELVLASGIESSDMPDDAIQGEIDTIARVLAAQARTVQRQAGLQRNLVPRMAGGGEQRVTPRLASDQADMPTPSDSYRVQEDEVFLGI